MSSGLGSGTRARGRTPGGKVILADRLKKPRTIERKGRIDLVTDADRPVKRRCWALSGTSSRGRPSWRRSRGRTAGRRAGGAAILHRPLGRDHNYAHGVPHFSTTVGVGDRSGSWRGPSSTRCAGSCSPPPGEGAFLGGSGSGSPPATPWWTLFSTGLPTTPIRLEPRTAGVWRLHVKVQSIRRLGSAALDLAYVAAGRSRRVLGRPGSTPGTSRPGPLSSWRPGACHRPRRRGDHAGDGRHPRHLTQPSRRDAGGDAKVVLARRLAQLGASTLAPSPGRPPRAARRGG